MTIKRELAICFFFSLLIIPGVHADEPWADYNPPSQTVKQYASTATLAYSPAASSNNAPSTHSGQARRKSLPKTELSSFVRNSGYRDDIYGDESNVDNTIYSSLNDGINGQSAQGLTTGQKSNAPSVFEYNAFAHY